MQKNTRGEFLKTNQVDKRIGVFDESSKPDLREQESNQTFKKKWEDESSSEIGVDYHVVYKYVYK